MKTISEIKQTATVLDRKALKNLLGGVGCAYGETKYMCTVTDTGGSFSGYVCGFSQRDAISRVRDSVHGELEIITC